MTEANTQEVEIESPLIEEEEPISVFIRVRQGEVVSVISSKDGMNISVIDEDFAEIDEEIFRYNEVIEEQLVVAIEAGAVEYIPDGQEEEEEEVEAEEVEAKETTKTEEVK